MNEPNSLWAQVLGNRYFRADKTIEGIQQKTNASVIWQSIVKAAPLLKQGTRMRVINGKATRFWLDSWLLNHPLISFAQIDPSSMDRSKLVADFWVQGKG